RRHTSFSRDWSSDVCSSDLPRSSWADYSEKLISKGGGVFPRTLKAIPLSHEAREALGIDAAELDPESLINALLKAPVDLLWFGRSEERRVGKGCRARRPCTP